MWSLGRGGISLTVCGVVGMVSLKGAKGHQMPSKSVPHFPFLFLLFIILSVIFFLIFKLNFYCLAFISNWCRPFLDGHCTQLVWMNEGLKLDGCEAHQVMPYSLLLFSPFSILSHSPSLILYFLFHIYIYIYIYLYMFEEDNTVIACSISQVLPHQNSLPYLICFPLRTFLWWELWFFSERISSYLSITKFKSFKQKTGNQKVYKQVQFLHIRLQWN